MIKSNPSEIRNCECGKPIPNCSSTGYILPPCRYKLKHTCGHPVCIARRRANVRGFILPKKICEGICGKELKPKPGERRANLKTRKSCGAKGCDEHIRILAKDKAKIKNCKRYHVDPDCVERFCLGLR